MIEFTGIHHISVLVADTAAALEFYCGLLGLQAGPARPDLGYPGAWLILGAQQIHLMELPNPDPTHDRPAHGGRDRHAALLVRELHPLKQVLEHARWPYTTSRSGRAAIFFRDPDGNAWEVMEG